MYDICLIGSGPSSLFLSHYLLKNTEYKICIVTESFQPFHCTYGIFRKNLENTWIFNENDFSNIFPNSYEIEMNCPYNNIDYYISVTDEKYYLLDNIYYFKKYNKEFQNKITIIEGLVTSITKDNENNFIFYKKNSKILNLKSKLVIEGSGHKKPIGIKYIKEYPINYQTFVGHKIITKKPHNIKKAILMDWYDTKINNNIPPSFCYIIPYSNNILFVEETILCHKQTEQNYYEILDKRLHKRLEDYKIKYSEIIFTEKDSISMNRFIPDMNSTSFGIGINGNIVNPVSGYSVGQNIRNIPIIVNLIKKHNFNTKNIYKEFWNNSRTFNFMVGLIGQSQLLSYKTTREYSLFFKKLITETNKDKKPFDIIFHNIYDDNIKSYLSFSRLCKIFEKKHLLALIAKFPSILYSFSLYKLKFL